MRKTIVIFSLVLSAWAAAQTLDLNKLQEGDLIFIKSQSSQSKALQEATRSPWTHVGIVLKDAGGQWVVAEAGRKVEVTPIDNFLRKSQKKSFVVNRVKPGEHKVSKTEVKCLHQQIDKYLGRPYDKLFQIEGPHAGDSIYCSELTYLVYDRCLGIKVGKMETFGDQTLGEESQKLIHERYAEKTFNVSQRVVTPVSQLVDSKFSHDQTDSAQDLP